MKSINPEITTRSLSPAIEGMAKTEPAPKVGRLKPRARRAAVALGISTILVGLSGGFAAAATPEKAATPEATVGHSITSSQDAYLWPGEGRQFGTWFFGRTVICFKNMGPEVASYEWISSTTFSSRSLAPHEQYCDSRSFVGFGIYVTNTSVTDSPIKVSLPYGP